MSLIDIDANPMFQMGLMRGLEILERGAMVDGHLYRHSIDSHWLGVAHGYCLAKGWASMMSDGVLNLTEAGMAELARRRLVNAPRMPDGVVPTSYRPGIIRAPDPRSHVISRGQAHAN